MCTVKLFSEVLKEQNWGFPFFKFSAVKKTFCQNLPRHHLNSHTPIVQFVYATFYCSSPMYIYEFKTGFYGSTY